MNIIYDLLKKILDRLLDVQQRSARIETRLFKLAEGLAIDVKAKEDWK